MLAAVKGYNYYGILSLVVLLGSIVLFICLLEPVFLLLPFGWILFPLIFRYTVAKPERWFWLLLILLPLSTEMNITPQLGLDFPDEIVLMLLTGMSIVKIVHQPDWVPVSLLRHPLFFILMTHFCWIMITCIYAAEPLLAVKYLLAKIWYIIPFVVLPQVILFSRERVGKLALCLLLPMLIVVMQFLVRYAFYHYSFADIKYVMAPFFRNHVSYSAMLAALLPVAWCVWKLSPEHSRMRIWIMAGMVTGVAGLLLSYSRGAWIALLAGILSVWVIKKKLMKLWIIMAAAALLISLGWLITDNNFMRFAPDHDHTSFHTDFAEHMRATIEMKDVSAAERFYRWVAGIRMIADKPVTGFGPNSFYLHYRPYTVTRFETWVSDNPEHSTVHNYFLLVTLEQGVIGLVLFSLLYFGMLIRLQKLYHDLQSRFYQTVALGTVMVLVITGVINSMSDMIETDKVGSLFWLSLGTTILLDQKRKEERGIPV